MKKLIFANWKCNPINTKQAKELAQATKAIVCAPFPYIPLIKAKCGQDCFWEDRGSFTGEVSPKMLKNLGVKYVLAGHSERRRVFNETNEIINKKIKAILKNNLIPVFCLGETKEEWLKGKTFMVLEDQIKRDLKGIPRSKLNSIIIAYEPVWAIGTGEPCLPEQAITAILFIRKVISRLFDRRCAGKIPVLYGGSVNSKNAGNYLKEKEISGLLIGGASLDKEEIAKIVKFSQA